MIFKVISVILVAFYSLFSFDLTYKSYNDFLAEFSCKGGVEYLKLKKNSTILNSISEELSSMSIKEYQNLNDNDKIAYLSNVYNFYTISLIIENYPLKNGIQDIQKPWDTKFIPLFGKKVSLNHIEHKILRKKFDEPRIHFALVCASKGCPEILNSAYTGKKLDSQFNEVAKKFLYDKEKNYFKGNKLYISKIFKWYGSDFNKKYSSYKKFIISTLGLNGEYDISFNKYDWRLNEVSGCSGQ